LQSHGGADLRRERVPTCVHRPGHAERGGMPWGPVVAEKARLAGSVEWSSTHPRRFAAQRRDRVFAHWVAGTDGACHGDGGEHG
jgi:hypothetical protein